MRNYLVSYDFSGSKDKKEYLELLKAIVSNGLKVYDLFDPTASTWLIQSQLSAWELGKVLINYFDEKDKLLVAEITPNVSWYGLNEDQVRWFLGSASLPLRLSRETRGEE